MPTVDRPRLHNRASGVVGKMAAVSPATKQEVPIKIDHIVLDLLSKVVPINSLTSDPDNARLHPERNLEAIKESLCTYGQRSLIVVRKEDMTVAKGNGTLEAAKLLGWTKIAASVQPMTKAEFHGYALADNRSAELAKWDFEIVSRLQKLHADTGHGIIGWTADELEVLRMAEWTPPPISDTEFNVDGKPSGIELSDEQRALVGQAVAKLREVRDDATLDEADCLVAICREWLDAQG